MISENIVREEQQPSTSSQNQIETRTERKQGFSDHEHFLDIISTKEVREYYLFIFFSVLYAT